MAWLRIDDRVRTHPKIVQAGPAAAWLWFCGICYCREHLTDGFIPALILPTLVPGMSQVKRPIAALITAGLWHEREGGYEVHDFLDWNPTRAEIVQRQRYEKDKKARQRGRVPVGQDGDIDGGQDGDSCTGARDHAQDAHSAGLGSVLASGSESSGESAKGGPEPQRGRGVMGSSYAKASMLAFQHRGHTLSRGPFFDAFVQRFDGDAAAADAWLKGEIDAYYAEGHRPGSMFKFIDERWEKRAPKRPESLARSAMGQRTEPLEEIWYVECDRIHATRCENGKTHYDKRDAERAKERTA